ncbi:MULTISPECIES: ribosomal L7Ae/L30e/S12e/Gadd45 family protein [Rummeliibacillus]|jgi:LSU ribosomal protein L7AE|uniref:ribosomal L7Ae/L30e/S12e/Gadd45 family protein n=1 Tax=Rummeliibacillus TaxID=648802 RepID=UPI0011B3D21E|nr:MULTISPECIES: ribosomal L7Ae/L30e/S12e/Gadd45 family protein [Rummeliibacillus]MBO2536400.1 ribosomal L7Ae/L30e/S12e/Gadd45 family protein [Rummeliibacillus suwonensis]
MSYEKVKQATKTIVGMKQTVKALQTGHVTEVFVALDADVRMTKRAVQLAQNKGIPVVLVDSKRELGRACGIHVDAAVCAIAE